MLAESNEPESYTREGTIRLANGPGAPTGLLSVIGPPGSLGSCDRPVKSRMLFTHVSYERRLVPGGGIEPPVSALRVRRIAINAYGACLEPTR